MQWFSSFLHFHTPWQPISINCTLCIVLVGKLEGKRPLGRPRHRWVDNIRMDLQEVGCGYMDWIGLAQDRESWRTLVSAVMKLQVPWSAGNFLTSCNLSKKLKYIKFLTVYCCSRFANMSPVIVLFLEPWDTVYLLVTSEYVFVAVPWEWVCYQMILHAEILDSIVW